MFSKFTYQTIPLESIKLDKRNPRILTQKQLSSEEEILDYLFEYEDLLKFIRQIFTQGRNKGAERPYVVKTRSNYTVVEGNTRIAAYKVLAGLLAAPSKFRSSVPKVPKSLKAALLNVDCSVAPSRDALLPVMAHSHFGVGDKSKWGYLGSRKTVYDEWKQGKQIKELADVFDCSEGEARQYILEYLLYLEAIKLSWTISEKSKLLSPAVKFNPPIRFLETSGHREKLGITLDSINLKIVFAGEESKRKFKHLVNKLVVKPQKGLGATAKYDDVFEDYTNPQKKSETSKGAGIGTTGSKTSTDSTNNQSDENPESAPKLKPHTLFTYSPKTQDNLIIQLMKEAKELNCKNFPGAATFLLRNILEAILKDIIHQQNANPSKVKLDLEACINICQNQSVKLEQSQKSILKQFKKDHLDYLNLGVHGNLIPNYDRLKIARDCISQFVKGNV